MKNSLIVKQLPAARKLYRRIEEVIAGYYAEYNKLTFDNVKTIAAMVTTPGTATNEALVRIIECENVVTVEYN